MSSLSHRFPIKFNPKLGESKRTMKIFAAVVVLAIVALLAIKVINTRNENASKEYYKDGMSAFKKGNMTDAVMRLEKAVALNSDDPNAHLNLARSYSSTGKLEESEKEYIASLKINPNQPESYYNLAIIYKSRGDFDKALVNLKKAKDLDKNLYSADVMMAYIYRQKNEPDKAIDILKQLMKSKPFGADLSNLHVELGLAYQTKGQSSLAEQQWREALNINKDNLEAKKLLGIE